MVQQNKLFRLPERCLIKVSGDDAESFLQNLVTQDMAQVSEDKLVYSCLLTPQGRFLHDFFIFKEEGAFFLECETQRREDLLRRLKMFKLRSKVIIEDCSADFIIYAGTQGQFKDPRLTDLGYRTYVSSRESAQRDEGSCSIATSEDPSLALGMTAYKDKRISLGVPEGSIDIKPEFDTLADMNLDKLHAVSWTKGCFVGQEVAARMENRALIKKRLMIVSGEHLAAGEGLTQNDVPVGEVRSVNAAGTEGLALLKLAALENGTGEVSRPGKSIIMARLPSWLESETSKP